MSQLRRRFTKTFLPAWIVMTLAWCAVILRHSFAMSLSGSPVRESVWFLGACEVFAYTWIRTRTTPLISQIRAILAILLCQALPFAVLKLDGFHGDGRAFLAWRWQIQPPDAEATIVRQSWHIPVQETTSTSAVWDATECDSPGFRGADRTGVVREEQEWRNWKQPPQERWRHPVGQGWSSFAVTGRYAVTQEQRGDLEMVVCYELESGQECWNHADPVQFHEWMGGPGPRATPTIHAGRVYALGATGILNCLDFATGQPCWSRDILQDNHTENALFGMCGSPLVVDQRVIVSPGGKEGSLVCYDATSGDIQWRGGEAPTSYSSPHLATFQTQQQVLIFNGEGLFGHQLATGDVLWSYPWISNPEERNNVGQPVVLPCDSTAEGRVLIASGYDRGCVCLEIKRIDDSYDVRAVWTSRHLKAKFSSVVLHDHYVYGLDERILTCLDIESGRTCWKGGRYGHGQILLVNDTLVIQCESGAVAFVEASPKRFRELGQLPVFTRRTWSQHVVAGPYLLVRNDREAACFAWPRPNNTSASRHGK